MHESSQSRNQATERGNADLPVANACPVMFSTYRSRQYDAARAVYLDTISASTDPDTRRFSSSAPLRFTRKRDVVSFYSGDTPFCPTVVRHAVPNMYMYVRIHTCTYTYMHVHIHARMCACDIFESRNTRILRLNVSRSAVEVQVGRKQSALTASPPSAASKAFSDLFFF